MVFAGPRLVVFCDGDFWHGRDWGSRNGKLRAGSNAEYWVTKIESNMERDKLVTRTLRAQGWKVVRIWESDLLRGPAEHAKVIQRMLAKRSGARS